MPRLMLLGCIIVLACRQDTETPTPTPTPTPDAMPVIASVPTATADATPTPAPKPSLLALLTAAPSVQLPIVPLDGAVLPTPRLVAEQTSVEGTAEQYSWHGALEGGGTVIISGRGVEAIGTVLQGTETRRLEPAPGGGLHLKAVRARPGPVDGVQELRGPLPTRASLDGKIRLAVEYTANAEQACPQIRTLIDHAIEMTNEVAANTHVTVRFELAKPAIQASFDETNDDMQGIMYAFADKNDQRLNEIHKLRRDAHADVAVLFVDKGNDGVLGIAKQTVASYDTAFIVINCRYALANYLLPHELGHLFGLNDDRDPPQKYTLSYGYGRANDSQDPAACWRTVMSTETCPCGCRTIPYWSNPAVFVGGVATGTKERSDNARVIERTAGAISRFSSTSSSAGK